MTSHGIQLRHAVPVCMVVLAAFLIWSCDDSNPVTPDTRAPYVGWVVPAVSSSGDTVFVFDQDTTTVQLNAGDDGGVVSNVKLYLDGALVATLTAAPYSTVVSLSGIRNNRSARVWATAADPTGKVGSTADTLRFVRSVAPDTATWTQLAPTRSPSARDGFTWEPDPAGNRALLFGGYSLATFSSDSDLWSFDLITDDWDSLVPGGTVPPSRTRHGAGIAAGVMVVFGGEHLEGVVDSVLEEYSLLDLGTMTWSSGLFDFALHPTMAMATSTLGSNVYFFGGTGAPADFAHDTLMRYDALSDQWQSLQPANRLPGNRSLAMTVANLEDAQIFLYGGTAGRTDDAPAGAANFRLDLASLAWVSTAAPGPPGLVDGAAVYDSADHRVLMWGGRDGSGGMPVEVWEFALGANAWRQVPTPGATPTGRTGHRLIYDAAHPPHGRLVMFGGKASGTWYNETWELAW